VPKDLNVCDEVASQSAVVSALQARVGDLTDVVRDLRSRVQRSEGLLSEVHRDVASLRLLVHLLASSAGADVASAIRTAVDEASTSVVL
jgi:hypothetical protein